MDYDTLGMHDGYTSVSLDPDRHPEPQRFFYSVGAGAVRLKIPLQWKDDYLDFTSP